MRLLFSTTIVCLGLWTVAVRAQQVTNVQAGKLVEALRLAAPKTGTENNGLYGEWQVKPDVIPKWSKQCTPRTLTPTQFAVSPLTERYILTCVMRERLQKEYAASSNNETVAVRRAACWWMTGISTGCKSGPTADYAQKVLSLYQQVRSQPMMRPSASPSRSTRPSASPSPSIKPSVSPPASTP